MFQVQQQQQQQHQSGLVQSVPRLEQQAKNEEDNKTQSSVPEFFQSTAKYTHNNKLILYVLTVYKSSGRVLYVYTIRYVTVILCISHLHGRMTELDWTERTETGNQGK